MGEPIIVDGFKEGTKMMLCPYQYDRCHYQFPGGDGAFLICTYSKCIELGKCHKDNYLSEFENKLYEICQKYNNTDFYKKIRKGQDTDVFDFIKEKAKELKEIENGNTNKEK